MSGGDIRFQSIAFLIDALDDKVLNIAEVDDEVKLKAKEVQDEMWILLQKLKTIDYYVCGDIGIETFRNEWNTNVTNRNK